jgi:hypothetical protein
VIASAITALAGEYESAAAPDFSRRARLLADRA